MKKILETNQPIISGFPTYGFLFSVLPKECMPWVYNNFIHLVHAKWWNTLSFADHNMLLKGCPGLEYYSMPIQFMRDHFHNSLKESAIYAIDNDCYVYIFVNRYYLPLYEEYYHKRDKDHELIISGYDLEKNIFYVSDNIDNGKYVTRECDMDCVEEAFQHVSREYLFLTDIRMIQRKKITSCEINIEQILFELKCYLYSLPIPDITQEQEFIYGLSVFDVVEKILEKEKNERAYIDLRLYQILYEHKVLMTLRVKYLEQYGYIDEKLELGSEFAKLERKYLILRNLGVKNNYFLGIGKDIYDKVLIMLKNLKEEEKVLTMRLIEAIETKLGIQQKNSIDVLVNDSK